MMPVFLNNLQDVTIDINGAIIASSNWKQWPRPNGGRYQVFMDYENCNRLTLQSSQRTGSIDG